MSPQYNGCRWRGGVLRVEKAHPGFLDIMRQEEEEDAALEAAAAAAEADGQQQHVLPPTDGAVVRVMRPDRKKARSVPANGALTCISHLVLLALVR